MPTSDSDNSDGEGVKRKETDTGLDKNVAGAISYLFGFVTGLIFFLTEDEDEFVRFHAAQSMVVFGGLFVLLVILGIVGISFSFLSAITGLAVIFGLVGLLITLAVFLIFAISLVLWIYLMYEAYNAETPHIPVAADIADSLV